MRLIDADALIDFMRKGWRLFPLSCPHSELHHTCDMTDIMNAPTIDAVPVRHGEWIDGKRMGLDGTFHWFRECLLCGYEREDDNEEKDTNYCPHCGAKMDGGKDNE